MTTSSSSALVRLITREELAALLRVSIPTIDRMCRIGQGPARMRLSSRRVGYRVTDVNSWLAEQAGKAGQ